LNLLGINAYHGDVSAVLVRDGELVAAVEEERFRRVKHWAGLPISAIRACLEIGGIDAGEIDHFAVSRNPRANLLRKVAFALTRRPSLGLVRDRGKNLAFVRRLPDVLARHLGLAAGEVRARTHWVEHHPAHLASACFVSPFEEAAVCAIDGFGDFVSTSTAVCRGGRLEVLDRVFFPHSLGLLYLAITQYLGFPSYGDEYKVMGLAAYGEPELAARLGRLVRLEKDGRFRLDLSYFRHHADGVSMSWNEGAPTIGPVWTPKVEELLGAGRSPDDPVEDRHKAVAASLQVVFEDAALHVLRGLHERTGLSRLCLAGGCAMNSVLNGKIRARTPFEEIWVQPAAADNGTALGAAYWVWNQKLGKERRFVMEHAYWGPEFGEAEVRAALDARRDDLKAQACEIHEFESHDGLCRWAAGRIAAGDVMGWFQGRMEWGARALGNRSILADPRRADMRDILNTRIKFREEFRPFAPSILEEALDDYFVDAVPDPFMIQVYPVRPEKRAEIPAVTHVDGSGRLQTVSRDTNPLYWRLIKAFEAETGVPVVLNTSFNESEPIVHTPDEALDCFLRTRMDSLILGSLAARKGPARQQV
jgi:carbamoyltransferase